MDGRILNRVSSARLVGLLLASACVVPLAHAQQAAPSGFVVPRAGPAAAKAGPHDVIDAQTSDRAKSPEAGDKSDLSKSGTDAGKKTAAAVTPKDRRYADAQAFFDARLAALHAGLTLDVDQEPLWPPVETAIRDLQKIRNEWGDRDQVADLLRGSPSDLLRMRSAQLIRRGEAMKALVESTGPLLDKLDDAQKRRLPLLLEGMRPARIVRAAFDIRDGRVMDDPDDDASPHRDPGNGMSRERRSMHDQSYDRDGKDEREGAAYDDGRGNPLAMQGHRADPADD